MQGFGNIALKISLGSWVYALVSFAQTGPLWAALACAGVVGAFLGLDLAARDRRRLQR